MHSATRLDDLKILECFLQNSLHAHLGRIIPFRVQCLYKDETLWVLAQHPADLVIDIPDTFTVLERALQAEEPKTPLAVKLYLRAEGNQRPYSQKNFTVYPLVKQTVPGEADPAMTGAGEDLIALDRDRRDLAPGKPLWIEDSGSIDSQIDSAKVSDGVFPDLDHLSFEEEDSSRLESAEKSIVKIDTDTFVSQIEHSFGNPGERNYESAYPPAAKPKRSLLLPILGGLGVIAIGSGAGYMGTRPCVLQVCTELTTSTQLTQASLVTINNPNVTGQEVLTAQKQLHQSVANLKSIPAWAGSYDTAQTALQSTEPQSTHLDTTVTAMNRAFQATNIVKNPPIPLVKWQESKRMWTDSIASLRLIPASSKVYPLAQQKLTNYQGRLADIERRIDIETAAEDKLKTAVVSIKSASQSQATAKSLTEWRSVKTRWDSAIGQLESIPAKTSVHTSAQGLLKSSQPARTIANDKVLEEDKAAQNYKNAVNFAQAAKQSQKNNQLEQAVSQWSQAKAAIQNIPQTSAVYSQAQPLIAEYTKSFQQADEQFKTDRKIALSNRDLQQTCGGNPQICSYTVSNKGIVVRLMSVYTQTLRQTAIAASNQGDGKAKVGILNHVNTLGNALQTISENAKLPLQVYGADGKQIQNYLP